MNNRIRSAVYSIWSSPDPVLAEAAVTGELLVAKIRLPLATVLLLIRVINTLIVFPMDWKEKLVGMSLKSGTFILSLIFYSLISRNYNRLWLSFATSGFDVTLVSSGLTFLDG